MVGGGKKVIAATLSHNHVRSWSHNPAATFSLCLLARAYEHAAALVFKLYELLRMEMLHSAWCCLLVLTVASSELQISVQFLVEIDKLVQLLESPIFIGACRRSDVCR